MRKSCGRCGRNCSAKELGLRKAPSGNKVLGAYCRDCRIKYKQNYRKGLEGKMDIALRLWESKSKRVKLRKYYAPNTRLREFTITVNDVRTLLNMQTIDGRLYCAATGVELQSIGHDLPLSPSLDRIDNSKGYIPGNVRIVALIYNVGRRNWADDDVIAAIHSLSAALLPARVRPERPLVPPQEL